ncbi:MULTISPECIES: glycosyltransferase family 2 protein [Lactobacillus]|uniref:Putative polysaccharide biosynthesis protein n=1 Tax=Lactobacillus apis TaxID=303541 RepID=A0A0F4LV24_9LACO|nr:MULTISPECIES: glycosyltransferase family 2 protein [Lactobacillus]KJY62144.1 putative polysaccharide biosynthesis protein [Lactobacillus apis]MBH9986310.1 glycosyltransferase [Lactobacillus sp. M0390]MCT6822082.1 glycosyltransferase [Lactobacillus apis]WLS85058.1 glycosyltransferase [Lactobacillus apis]
MIQQPELTVIMPVYNVEKYLARALDHLAKQDDPNFKLLIVNDGSTDSTRKIAEQYRDQFRYFNIINKPNGGLSDARNVGIENVDTPYFTFHDGDDWVDSGYTAFFVRAFHDHPDAAMVSCGFWLDYENKEGSIPATKKNVHGMKNKLRTYQLVGNPLGSLMDNHFLATPVKGYTWNKGYKLSVVKHNHLHFMSDLAFMEDQIFTVQYLALTDGFYCDSTPLYHYWQRKDSMVHKFNLKMIPDNFKANYFIIRTMIRSLWQEHKKEKGTKHELIEASERDQR